jgi:phosphatidate phosphatase APP1
MLRILLLFSFFMAQAQALVIVSDFDDTIKITNAGNLAAAAYNGIFKSKVYTGMPEFLAEARSYSTGLHIVSAAPSVVAPRMRSLLRIHRIEYTSLNYRLIRAWDKKIPFKIKAIEHILESGEEVILLGDDVERDPEIFLELKDRFPGKILAAYIHQVKNRKLPSGVIAYYTSFDLALNEYLAGRMTEASVYHVLASFETPKDLKRTFPGFSYCPKEQSSFQWQQQSSFNKGASELADKIIEFCSQRSAQVK